MKTSLAALVCGFSALSCLATAQQNPPQWQSSTAYFGGTLVRGSDGNFYRAIHNSTSKDPVSDPHAYWELYYCGVGYQATSHSLIETGACDCESNSTGFSAQLTSTISIRTRQ